MSYALRGVKLRENFSELIQVHDGVFSLMETAFLHFHIVGD